MKSRNLIWAITVAVVTALVISAKLARRMRPYQQRKRTQRANHEGYDLTVAEGFDSALLKSLG